MLMSSNIMRIFISLYTVLCMLTVPHTCGMLLHQKIVFWGRFHSLQCGKTFLKQTAFLNHSLFMLSFGPIEACKHTVFSLLHKIS
jgi:hypothetical protein